jgi:hypothetical protein
LVPPPMLTEHCSVTRREKFSFKYHVKFIFWIPNWNSFFSLKGASFRDVQIYIQVWMEKLWKRGKAKGDRNIIKMSSAGFASILAEMTEKGLIWMFKRRN